MQSPRCSFLHKWEYQEFSRLVGHSVYWNCQINSWFLTNVLHRLSKTTVTFVGHGSKYVSVCIVMLLSSRVLMREKCLHDPKIAYLASVVWFFFSLTALNKRNLGGFSFILFFPIHAGTLKKKRKIWKRLHRYEFIYIGAVDQMTASNPYGEKETHDWNDLKFNSYYF